MDKAAFKPKILDSMTPLMLSYPKLFAMVLLAVNLLILILLLIYHMTIDTSFASFSGYAILISGIFSSRRYF